MRKHLAEDFDAIYILNLGGNARKGLTVSDSNVFGIRVGVSINFLVKTKQNQPNRTCIHYHSLDELWNKRQKFDFLEANQNIGVTSWQNILPDARFTWLTEGLEADFDRFVPLGSKATKAEKGEVNNVLFKYTAVVSVPAAMRGFTISTESRWQRTSEKLMIPTIRRSSSGSIWQTPT